MPIIDDKDLPDLPDMGDDRYKLGPIEFSLKSEKMVAAIYALLRYEDKIRKQRILVAGLCKARGYDLPDLDCELGAVRVTRRKPTEGETEFKDWRIRDFYDKHYDGPCPTLSDNIVAVPGATDDILAGAVDELVRLVGKQFLFSDYLDDCLHRGLDIPDTVYTYRATSTAGTTGWQFHVSDLNRTFVL